MFISRFYKKNPPFTSYKRDLSGYFLNFLQYEKFSAFVNEEAIKKKLEKINYSKET